MGVFVTILVTDALFCSLCVGGIIQFKELKDRLQNLQMDEERDEAKLWKDLKECVEHHNLLIR